MLTEAEKRDDVLAIRKILGIVYCPTCEQDTMPFPSGRCAFCDHYIVFKDGEAA